LALLVALHLVALRTVGSNNPDGVEIKNELDAKGKPVDGCRRGKRFSSHATNPRR
jgi:ubiquinol-cytochrome c reductase cytochrome b subunit